MIEFLKVMNRLRLGHRPIFVEYDYDFEPRWAEGGNRYILEVINRSRSQIEANLASMSEFLPLIKELSSETAAAARVNWKNHFIPALDGMSLMWATSKSKATFVEVGSGNSTIFVRRSIEYFGLKTKLISIDPFPRIGIDGLCDEIIRKPLEKMDLTIFEQLDVGDVVFIDNSHRSFMNSDVTVVMLDVLPRLKPGVLVGIHDIFLPYDYFKSWAPRGFNEQYLLASYLLSNPNYFDIMLSNYWTWTRKDHVAPLMQIWNFLGDEIRDRSASAFWGVKR